MRAASSFDCGMCVLPFSPTRADDEFSHARRGLGGTSEAATDVAAISTCLREARRRPDILLAACGGARHGRCSRCRSLQPRRQPAIAPTCQCRHTVAFATAARRTHRPLTAQHALFIMFRRLPHQHLRRDLGAPRPLHRDRAGGHVCCSYCTTAQPRVRGVQASRLPAEHPGQHAEQQPRGSSRSAAAALAGPPGPRARASRGTQPCGRIKALGHSQSFRTRRCQVSSYRQLAQPRLVPLMYSIRSRVEFIARPSP